MKTQLPVDTKAFESEVAEAITIYERRLKAIEENDDGSNCTWADYCAIDLMVNKLKEIKLPVNKVQWDFYIYLISYA